MPQKVYDLSQLEALAAGSDDFVKSMVDTFLEHTPGQLEEMKEAYNRKDIPTMGAIAHKIKPNIDLFGISSISDEIRDIEKHGKGYSQIDNIETKIEKVSQTLETAFSQLREL